MKQAKEEKGEWMTIWNSIFSPSESKTLKGRNTQHKQKQEDYSHQECIFKRSQVKWLLTSTGQTNTRQATTTKKQVQMKIQKVICLFHLKYSVVVTVSFAIAAFDSPSTESLSTAFPWTQICICFKETIKKSIFSFFLHLVSLPCDRKTLFKKRLITTKMNQRQTDRMIMVIKRNERGKQAYSSK